MRPIRFALLVVAAALMGRPALAEEERLSNRLGRSEDKAQMISLGATVRSWPAWR